MMKSLFGAIAFSAALLSAAPSFAQSAAFDTSQFSPDTRAAIQQARDAQRRAMMAAARSGGTGAGLVRFEGVAGDEYAGECSPCSGDDTQRNGYGVLSWDDGEFYAGSHARGGEGGMKHGYGVYVFANGDSYEGQISAEQFNGFGVFWNADGSVRHAGRFLNGQPAN